MTKLSHADAAWLHMELPDNLMMITGLLYLDRVPEREHLEAVLLHRLCAYQRFQMKVCEASFLVGSPEWKVDKEFEVSNHLVYETIDDFSEEKLLSRCGELMSEPLDRSRPLWEFRVFPSEGDKAHMVVRLHHAIADGIALMRVLLTLCDETENASPPAPSGSRITEARPSAFKQAKLFASRFLHESHDLLFHPSHAAELAHTGLQAGKALTHLLGLPADGPNALKGELSRNKVTAVSRPLSLSEVKLLGKRLGCTINDILMAGLSGALGKTLSRLQKVDKDTELRAVLPVDLRAGKVHELGNQFGLVFLTLPVGKPQASERIRIVREHMTELKNSAEAVVAFELLSAVGAVPSVVEKPIIEWFGNKATAVVTNLPGPRQTLFLGGSKIDGMMYWVPQSGRLGLGISLMSYDGQLRIGVTSDANVLPEPKILIDDFLKAYAELEALESL